MSPLFKRVLRKEISKKKLEPEVSFLNITALMDMMTIILVFLLKTLSQSTAQQPPNADLTMPKSVISAEPAEDGVTVLVTKTHVIVDDQVILDVPTDATHGAAVADKRGGPNDLYLTKLGVAAKAWRDRDKQLRRLHGQDSSSSEATIIVDKDTPYRFVAEVLYTLGQSEFAKYHLMVMQGAAP